MRSMESRHASAPRAICPAVHRAIRVPQTSMNAPSTSRGPRLSAPIRSTCLVSSPAAPESWWASSAAASSQKTLRPWLQRRVADITRVQAKVRAMV
ncbi:hypothetical protein ACN28I_20370 [Archangium gephyra]|uniref:hypothetical protein n=1 Tax=Archangium gephyra TaxID=48 RepID=UPI003B7840A1